MPCTNTVTLNGYQFTFVSSNFDGVNTTFCYNVKGLGTSANALSNWVLEVDCPADEFTVISCTKQVLPGGSVQNANCEKVTAPQSGQVNLIGVKFNVEVGKNETIQFCVKFAGQVFEGCVNVGFKAGNPTFQTTTRPIIGPTCDPNPDFCCTVSLPSYLSLASTTPKISFDPTCLECIDEGNRIRINGCVPIEAAIQVQNICGVKSWLCCSGTVCGVDIQCRTRTSCEGINFCNVIGIIDTNAVEIESTECPGKKLVQITATVTITCPT